MLSSLRLSYSERRQRRSKLHQTCKSIKRFRYFFPICLRVNGHSSQPPTAVHLLLHQGSQSKSPSTPDIYSLDSGSLTLRIRLPNGTTIQLILPLGGPFTTQNLDLIQVLDEFIEKHFSARLLGKTGCFLVGKASLTGGYLHFLCSTAEVVEVEESAEDHVKVENSPGDHILGAKVKYLLVCRLVELVSELLKAIRPQQDLNRGRDWISNAYAASVVLHYELYYFKCGVRSGLLKNNVRMSFGYCYNLANLNSSARN